MLRSLAAVTLVLVLLPAVRSQQVDIRSITRPVALSVPVSAFNLVSGAASVTSSSAISTVVRSRTRAWTFNVRSTTSTFSHTASSGAPVTSKPVSSLLIRQAGAGSFGAISTTNAIIASGSPTTNAGVNVSFDLRFDTSLADSPGAYSTTLVFTIFTL